MNNTDKFVRWFRQATGHEPYPFQIRFADGTGSATRCLSSVTKAGLGEGEGKGRKVYGVSASWWMC